MSTALGEYKKFEIPVNVSAPKFEDLFDKSAAWKDNNVILTVDQTGKALSMPAYKLKNDAEAANLSWEISDGDLAEYEPGAVTVANLQLKADAFTSDHKIKTIAVSKAIYSLDATNLPNLTVESSAFTVTLKSLLEGAKLVNYVDGVEVPFATNTSELIVNRLELANLKPADLKDKDGAAFVISNTDYVFGNANTQKFYLSNKSGVYYLNETGYTFSFDSKAGEEATFSLDDKKVTITGLAESAESYTTTLTIKVNDVVVDNKYKETTIEVPVTRNK